MKGKLRAFRQWLSDNDLKPTNGYKLLAEGKIETVTIGRRRFVTEEGERKFLESLKKEQEA